MLITQTTSLQVYTNLNELTQVLNWFEDLSHASIPGGDWLRCKTALAEIFTNAVRHAHKNLPPETPISLEASLSKNTIEIKVFDYGAGFNLPDKLSKLDDIDVNALGGRGLFLISQMVDIFTYTKTCDGRNCMQVSKNYVPIG